MITCVGHPAKRQNAQRYFLLARHFAQRFLCAAAIRARAAGERFLRLSTRGPKLLLSIASALSAASMRSRSCFNSRMILSSAFMRRGFYQSRISCVARHTLDRDVKMRGTKKRATSLGKLPSTLRFFTRVVRCVQSDSLKDQCQDGGGQLVRLTAKPSS
jgi:hypothetical protein